MLLNLASVAHTDSKDVLWQYLRRYVPGATPENAPYLDRLLTGAVAYYQDFVKASKKFRLPAGKEREALQDLADTLAKLPERVDGRVHPERGLRGGQAPLRAGRAAPVVQDALRSAFRQRAGPRMGAFIKLYGRDNVVKLIERALAGEDLSGRPDGSGRLRLSQSQGPRGPSARRRAAGARHRRLDQRLWRDRPHPRPSHRDRAVAARRLAQARRRHRHRGRHDRGRLRCQWRGNELLGRNEAVGGHYVIGFRERPEQAAAGVALAGDRVLLCIATIIPMAASSFPLDGQPFVVPVARPGDDLKPRTSSRCGPTAASASTSIRHLARRRLPG